MSDQLPRTTSRPLSFTNGTAVGISAGMTGREAVERMRRATAAMGPPPS